MLKLRALLLTLLLALPATLGGAAAPGDLQQDTTAYFPLVSRLYPPTYSISGRVTENSQGKSGVMVQLTWPFTSAAVHSSALPSCRLTTRVPVGTGAPETPFTEMLTVMGSPTTVGVVTRPAVLMTTVACVAFTGWLTAAEVLGS